MPNLVGLLLLVIIGGMFAIIIAGIIIVSAREMAIWFCLKRSGKRAEARVEDLYYVSGRGRDYFIRFCPLVDEGVSVTQLINWRGNRRFRHRETVTVSYLPELPIITRLSGQDDVSWGRGIPTVVAIVLIGVFPPAIVLWSLIFAAIYLHPQLLTTPQLQRILWPESFPLHLKPKNGNIFS